MCALDGGTINIYSGKILRNKCVTTGGGLVADPDVTINMYGGEVCDNESNQTGAGVRIYHGTFNMYGGKISGNKGGTSGAAIDLISNSVKLAVANIYGGEVSGNEAVDSGGAILLSGANATLNIGGTPEDTEITCDSIVIKNNTAGVNGGAIFMISGTLKIEGKSATEKLAITGNKAIGDGGAIYQGSGTLELTNCTIENNKAYRAGGGLQIIRQSKDYRLYVYGQHCKRRRRNIFQY